MKSISFLFLIFVSFLFSCSKQKEELPVGRRNLEFTELAGVWDEAMPLGNGMVGNFVLDNPFEDEFQTQKEYTLEDSRIVLNMDAGETVLIEFE